MRGSAEPEGLYPATQAAGTETEIQRAPFAALHVLLLAAHPDDEILGAGGQFATMRRLTLVHLTDGASSHREAWSRGWWSRGYYAAARLREAADAARTGGTEFEHSCLGARDRVAAETMAELAVGLAMVLRRCRPDLLLTHAYEGGHADHDAAAFVAHAACRLVPGIPVWEMTGYRAAQAGTPDEKTAAGHVGKAPAETGRFLPAKQSGEIRVDLDPDATDRKQRMLACFTSQRRAITELEKDLSVERFRPTPGYDFAQPPHEGTLLYEQQSWARMTGAQWRCLAAAAAATIDLMEPGARMLTVAAKEPEGTTETGTPCPGR